MWRRGRAATVGCPTATSLTYRRLGATQRGSLAPGEAHRFFLFGLGLAFVATANSVFYRLCGFVVEDHLVAQRAVAQSASDTAGASIERQLA